MGSGQQGGGGMTSVLGFIRESAWDKMEAVQYYRVYLPLRECNAHGLDATVVGHDQLEGASDDELGGRDVYVMARMYHEDCEEFIAEIHRRGGILVLDSDDDLTEDYKLVSGRGPEFKKVLNQVDYVTCSTPALAAHFAQYTARPPTVLRNHVDVDWMQATSTKARRLVDGLTIGFSGSPTHWGDWYLPAVPFARIARDYDVVPVLHGEHPRYLKFAHDDMVRLGGVPFSLYPVLLRQFDIVLCAVDSRDEFNAGKSAVKALEAMAVGAIPICSQFQPYMELAEAGAPVVIIEEESRDGWYEAMREVIEDDEYRLDLRARGEPWVQANRDMGQTGYKFWESFYRGIAD